MLAVFGLVVCVAGGIGVLVADMPAGGAVALFGRAATAPADIVVIARRKARGEPG